MNLDVAKRGTNLRLLLYDFDTNKYNLVWKVDLKIDTFKTKFVDSKISPLLTDLHIILVGNSPTKFSTIGSRDMTTRSYEGITLGKHLNNIFASKTNQVSTLSAMICHILGTTKHWD